MESSKANSCVLADVGGQDMGEVGAAHVDRENQKREGDNIQERVEKERPESMMCAE